MSSSAKAAAAACFVLVDSIFYLSAAIKQYATVNGKSVGLDGLIYECIGKRVDGSTNVVVVASTATKCWYTAKLRLF